nr:hypothetical protein [Tanacetum cinerariifolium]
KEVHNKLLQHFAKVEKHSISLEIALQKCKEQVKNDTVWNEKASNVFRREHEQYIKIQDLKAQLQDKNIAISELKKLIEKGKGKAVDTKFDKPSVVQQPNAQRIPKPSVLGKPTPFSNSLESIYFSKTKSVPKAIVLEGLSKPVTAQNLPQTTRQSVINTNVLKPGMYQIDNRSTQTRAPQLPQIVRNTNPRVSTSTGVNHKTNVSRPQHRSNQLKDKVVPNNCQVKLKNTQVEVHPRIPSVYNKMKSVTVCKDSLNSRTLNANAVCATCKKCLVDSNHFSCVTKMLNDVNARTRKPNVVPISTKKPKGHANKSVATPHKKKVASKSTNQKPQSYYKMLYEKTIGQFCDADLEFAFRKSTCFVKDLQADAHVPSQQELDLLFGPLYDEFFNAGSNPQDKQPTMNIQPTSATSTPTYVHAEENNDDQAEEDHLPDDEFTNPFCAPAQEVAESSSHNIVIIAIRVLIDRPIRLESLATWDGGNITWEGQVGALGTVPVCVCTGKAGVRDGFLAGKVVKLLFREIEFLLYQGEDSDFKDSIDQSDLTHCDDLFVDPTPEMFTDEQPPDYSFPPRFDVDDDLPSPDNEDKVFNPGILIHDKSVTVITRFAQEKKLAVSFASLLFEDFDLPFYELLVFKEVPNLMRLLPFSSENEEKVFKPGIYTSEKVKENPKKDKIGSKTEKREAWRSREKSEAVTVDKE